MTDDPIPDDVKTFLLRYIDSIAQLEALLLLRANAELAWSADTLAKRLYIPVQETAELLAHLCADGFLAVLDSQPLFYQYHCTSSEQAHMFRCSPHPPCRRADFGYARHRRLSRPPALRCSSV